MGMNNTIGRNTSYHKGIRESEKSHIHDLNGMLPVANYIQLNVYHYNTLERNNQVEANNPKVGASKPKVGVKTNLLGVSLKLVGVKTNLLRVSLKLVGVKTNLLGVSLKLVGVRTNLVGVSSFLPRPSGYLPGVDTFYPEYKFNYSQAVHVESLLNEYNSMLNSNLVNNINFYSNNK